MESTRYECECSEEGTELMIRELVLAITLAAAVEAQTWPAKPAFAFDSQRSLARDDADYQAGLSNLDAHQWDQAIRAFSASAAKGKANADAALYWKAYAQNRSGRREEALATLRQLREKYPASRWLKDAGALNLEVRAQSGSPVRPSDLADDDLKLMAVNSLMQSDPGAAFPVVEKVLASDNSEKVKERALFILTQNPSPEANKLLGQIAIGKSNPDLQVNAIRYMGMMGSEASQKELASIYGMSSDAQVKRAILQSFMQSGARDSLVHVAKTELDPQLRRDAIRQLAMTGGDEQLWQIYRSDSSTDDRKAILESLFMSGKPGRLLEIAKSDSNPELRVAAVRSLGMMSNQGLADQLVSIYKTDRNTQVRKAVLNALFMRQDGKTLVALARQEKDSEMKKEIVSKMSLIQSKDVTDYLMELLK